MGEGLGSVHAIRTGCITAKSPIIGACLVVDWSGCYSVQLKSQYVLKVAKEREMRMKMMKRKGIGKVAVPPKGCGDICAMVIIEQVVSHSRLYLIDELM